MNEINNTNPKNNLISNPVPKNRVILNTNPHNNLLESPNFAYIETRTILKGQPLPWGINWAITYPETLVFQGVRV